ncbi:DUF5689 domain-containing protein [Myroides odoratimimus]|uniref:DUF5689 domain-containing protein n=1 Tax=Myroides odoratimimus TaxID=76832 RepID=UPI0031013C01
MKTIFKSLLYFSFAGLILTGCAKNDDFSVPPVNCNEPNIAANQTIDGLYSTVKEDSKVVAQYTKDETISGIVVSSDQGGNFHQQLYIVDENTQTPVTLKVDIKGAFALYPVGSKVFVKLNGTYIHNSYGMITIGGGIYTSGSGNKYADVITGSKLRNTLYRSCNVITGDEFDKYINVVTLEQLQSDKTLIGKLIRVNEVQFDRSVVGKTYYDKDDKESNDAQGQTLRKMVDKKGNSLVVRTGQYSNAIKDQIIPEESGSITGIVSEFQGTLQFYPRTMEDMKLDQDPFEEGTSEPGVQEEIKFFGNHVFKGADFENWDLFKAITSAFPLPDYVVPVSDNYSGVSGKQSLHINGSVDKNSPIFTMSNVPSHKGATKLSFIMKGSSKKTISIEIIKKDGKTEAYNVINFTDPTDNKYGAPATTLSKSLTIEKAVEKMNNGNGSNAYMIKGGTHAIDTKGTWVKVTLNIAGVEYNDTGKGDFMRVRIGNTDAYDLKIDEMRFEDGTPGEGGGETPKPDEEEGIDRNEPNTVANFSKWDGFIGSLNKYKLLPALGSESKTGKDGKAALQIKGTHSKNDYLFTIENQTVKKDAKKIVMYVKGTTAKSLSFNVFREDDDDKGNKRYDAFNIRTDAQIDSKPTTVVALTSSIVLKKTTRMQTNDKLNGNNDYTNTTIDTKGDWIKITLDISDVNYNKTGKGSLFAIKVGSKADYNILVSDIVFE